jgi:hypothetical protein
MTQKNWLGHWGFPQHYFTKRTTFPLTDVPRRVSEEDLFKALLVQKLLTEGHRYSAWCFWSVKLDRDLVSITNTNTLRLTSHNLNIELYEDTSILKIWHPPTFRCKPGLLFHKKITCLVLQWAMIQLSIAWISIYNWFTDDVQIPNKYCLFMLHMYANCIVVLWHSVWKKAIIFHEV